MDITTAAFDKFKKYKEVAGYIKREMDKKHSDTNNKVRRSWSSSAPPPLSRADGALDAAQPRRHKPSMGRGTRTHIGAA